MKRERSTSQPRIKRPSPTAEQLEVLRAIRSGESCRIVANAGAGKTATILMAYDDDSAPRRRVLFLEYNRDLKEDVQARVQQSAALRARVQATNYDSLLVQYYDAAAPSKDFALSLLAVVENDAPPYEDVDPPLAFDVLVLDEAQDLDELYLRFVRKLLRDNRRPEGEVQLISVGDAKQTIYRYRGADPKYFCGSGGDCLHASPPRDFSLGATFRFGRTVCDLVDVLGRRLFPQEPYLPHVPATNTQSSIARFVLPVDRTRLPTALLAHLRTIYAEVVCDGGEPMAWLAGTTKSSNARLWDVVEALGMHDLYVATASSEQLADRPIPQLAARVQTSHQAKGKSYDAAALFLTNRQTWIDPRTGLVAPEIVYVALTRARRRLVIVESADSMIFHDVLVRLQIDAGHPAVPPPRCAVDGEVRPPPAPGQPAALWMPPTIVEALSKADGRSKQALLELVDAPPLGPWGDEDGVEVLPPLSELGAQAVWTRVEYARRERVATAGLWQALATPAPITSQLVYPRFYAAEKNRLHRLTPSLAARLDRLVQARPLERFGWSEWLELARFSGKFNYGHVALPPRELRDDEACELHLQRVMAALSARPAARPSTKQLRDSPLDAPGLFVDAQGVLLLILDDVESERSQDRLLAAVAAAAHEVPGYEIAYVRRGRTSRGRVEAPAHMALRHGALRLLKG